MKGDKGFTLTEIIVGLVVFSVVAVPASLMFARTAFKFRQSDKMAILKYAGGVMAQSLNTEGELYDSEKSVNLSGNYFMLKRTVLERGNITVTIAAYKGGKRLFELNGYRIRE